VCAGCDPEARPDADQEWLRYFSSRCSFSLTLAHSDA
jgi:hypothetical protein